MSSSHVLSTIPPIGDFDHDPVGAAMLITFQNAICESLQRKHYVLGGCFGGPERFWHATASTCESCPAGSAGPAT